MGCKVLYLLILVSAVVYVQATLQEKRSILEEKQLSRGVRHIDGLKKSPCNSKDISEMLEYIKNLAINIKTNVGVILEKVNALSSNLITALEPIIRAMGDNIKLALQNLAKCLSHNKCKI